MRFFIKICAVITLISLLLSTNSYAAVDNYTPKEKQFLLNLAREALYWYLDDKSIPTVEDKYLTSNLLEKKACFVTLNDKNGLRGCMGMFEPVNTPLYKNVIDRAIASAAEDPRFILNRIKYDELYEITIEISILTSPQDLKFSSPEDLLAKLRPFVDGIILTTPYGASTFLPQVWEQLPTKEDFLSQLCKKHGAPADFWKTNYKNLKVQVYEVIHFAEQVPGGKTVGSKGATVGKGGGVVLGHVLPLKENLEYGAYPVKEGQKLEPGTIVTTDTVLISN